MNLIDMQQLFDKANEARKISHSPYSHYSVGAALLCEDGTVYTGCNIENAAFSPTICAERVAIFKAISEGKKGFCAIAVSGGNENSEKCTPCGVCRQVMMEFCNPDNFIIVYKDGEILKSVLLGTLLPDGFGPGNLK